MKTVLLIEDHKEFREFLATMLLDEGFDVISARCPDDAFKTLRSEGGAPDLILSDLEMPFTLSNQFFKYKYSYEVGLQSIEELAWVFEGVPVIAMTALPEAVVKLAKERFPAFPVLRKPFHHDVLLTLIRELTSSTNALALLQ
jgi:CheY-like chemotaxis protein